MLPDDCRNKGVLILEVNERRATGSACTSEKITTPTTVCGYLCFSCKKTHDNQSSARDPKANKDMFMTERIQKYEKKI
jgi:hypothetical protein